MAQACFCFEKKRDHFLNNSVKPKLFGLVKITSEKVRRGVSAEKVSYFSHYECKLQRRVHIDSYTNTVNKIIQ